jgi:hypothetical protein
MKRNAILVLLCVALAGVAVWVSRKGSQPSPQASPRVVVTTGGQVTVLPPENQFQATIVADFPKTNAPATTK